MEGHLYQRGKAKTWYLLYDEPFTSGKRRQRSHKIGVMSKKDAEIKKRAFLRSVDDSTLAEESAGTTAEQFFDAWLALQKPYLAANTHERYSSLLRKYAVPHFGQLLLSQVQPEHIRRVYDAARESGLSGRSCLHIHRVLHTAFAHAVRSERILKESPVDRVKAPKTEEYQVKPISADQVRALIEIAQGTRLEVPVALTAVTGLRRGEVLALRWANVDLERGSLFVNEALEQIGKHVASKCPKSKSSRRSIPLAPETIEMLREHKLAQGQERAKAPFYIDKGLVFPDLHGEWWKPDSFTVSFGLMAKSVGLKGFRFHDLRHAFATLTLADGRPIKEVQLLMGHSTANTTLNVYARAIEGLGREAVNGLSRTLLAPQG